ncbi:MAG: PDDEXK nuclease domain-containing protein [Clostridiales bacterium]|jgi:predicted nuclease of restriction endonuclease-like (RecB) superfamily|nr:PDDEXK nuclease domain-containing protein [Clostridiales bacterium]
MAKKKNTQIAVTDEEAFSVLVKQVKELIRRHQLAALRAVNSELIQLYWEIGEEIVRRQAEHGWGDSVVEDLAKELQIEFSGEKGYSVRNLWRMRTFFLEYSNNTILPPVVAELGQPNKVEILPPPVAELNWQITSVKIPTILQEIGWTHNYVILEKCKDKHEREFYIKMTKRFGWSKNVLINNIEKKTFEKFLINQTNFSETVAEKYRHQAKLAVKDEYSIDFIELSDDHSERELEDGIIKNVRGFLTEMGGDFCYIGNQYHLEVADDDYYIDLLLFHRRLRSLVAIELKTGEFKPEYAGKMQFYLTALDETMKQPDENPSIGIIICKSKNRTKVEYTLKTTNKPIGVATYSYYDTLPESLKALLPLPDEIAAIIKRLESETL